MDNKQKEASIEFILSQGLSKPKSMCALISEMVKRLGFRFIFWDASYSLIFAILTVIPILMMLILVPTYFRFTAAVSAAPTLFLLILAFAETAERLGGLYEIKQTCHYTVRQVTALRVMYYSTAGMLYSTGIALFSMENMFEFLSLFMLCLSSLFICAILTLTAMRHISMKWAGIVCATVWATMTLAAPFLLGKKWEDFLKGIPTAVTLGICAIGMALFILELRKMLMEVKPYVVA